MKPRLEILALPLGIFLAAGCGARSPLDLQADESAGSLGGSGGSPGSGGRPATGGVFGGGGRPATGGVFGGGGRPATGGVFGGGGRPATGGVPGTGGIRYAGGGAAGGFGGQAGYGPGGSPASGGGRAGSGAGGSIGGSAGSTGRDGGFGGSAGSGGRDGGIDVRTGGAGGGSIASGGTVSSGGAIGTGGTSCPGLGSNEDLIDDLNDGNRYILSVNGRVGSWTDSDDGTPGGTMSPDPVNPFNPTDTGDPCRKYVAYVKGGGFSDWGADFWFGLGSPYDASKYTGISFWAKSDISTPPTVLRVTFPDKDTFPDGGICQTNVTGPTACYDHYGSRITLGTGWKKYTVSFSQISQDGWGMQGASFDPRSLYEVLFQIPVNATFSIWIDDVAFTF